MTTTPPGGSRRALAALCMLLALSAPSTLLAQESGFDFGDDRPPAVAPETNSGPKVSLSGYIDVGFFRVMGDGSGTKLDVANTLFPDLVGSDGTRPWVFAGDPLSTAVNSRGEPADTGSSRAVAFDSIDAGDKASFLVNELNMDLLATISPELYALASVDFVPRKRLISDPDQVQMGDFIDIDRAYIEYVPYSTAGAEIVLQAGKFDSVLGREYRVQESPDRFGVTPSLMHRYIGGHPIGLKSRFLFFDRAMIFNLAVTNGSHFSENFPLGDEVDSNFVKTVAGRLSYRFPVAGGLDIGISGLIGSQDGQDDDGVLQWQFGADVHLLAWDLEVTGEYQQGRAEGVSEAGELPCGVAQCLEFQTAYGEAIYRFATWMGLLFRVDWRDAMHEFGTSYVYVANLIRFTTALRFDFLEIFALKLEYVHNRELGDVPSMDNDVVTSSIVVHF